MWQFRNVSITKKLYFIVATMAILIVLELLTLRFSMRTLSSVRTLVGAEGLWSKAQKDGIYQLGKYYRTMKEEDYVAFTQLLAVPLGDHKARLELFKEDPVVENIRLGFLEGGVNPGDIGGIIDLLRRFHNVYYLKQAIGIWTQGDSLLFNMISMGQEIHEEINSGAASKEKLDSIFAQIDPLNRRLTILENRFSATLGEGSRWLENIIFSLLFLVALTVEITGLMLSIYVARSMSKGLKELLQPQERFLKVI